MDTVVSCPDYFPIMREEGAVAWYGFAENPARIESKGVDLRFGLISRTAGIQVPVSSFDDRHDSKVAEVYAAGSLEMCMAKAQHYIVLVVIARAMVPLIIVARCAPPTVWGTTSIRTQLDQSKGRDGTRKHMPVPAGSDDRPHLVDGTLARPLSRGGSASGRRRANRSLCDLGHRSGDLPLGLW